MTRALSLVTRSSTLGLALGLVLSAAAPAWAERVGISSAVDPGAATSAPEQVTRTLLVGQDIFFNQQIKTDATGRVQVLFLDRSSLSVGPDAELTIDEFVYDPNAGSGKLTASIGKGLVRFVGGAVSKSEGGVALKTPVATIGIRGGVGLIDVGLDGTTNTTFIYGERLIITMPSGKVIELTRPGFGVSIFPGGRFTNPALASFTNISTALKILQGRGGGNAQDIDNKAGVGASTGTNLSSVTPSTGNGGTLSPDQRLVAQSTQFPPGTVKVAFVGGQTGQGGPVTPYTTGDFTPSAGNSSIGTINATVDAQTFTFPASDGYFTVTNNAGQSSSGTFNGNGYLSPDHSFFYADLFPTNQANPPQLLFGGVAATAAAFTNTAPGTAADGTIIRTYALQGDQILGSTIPFLHPNAGGNIAGATVSPLYMVSPANTAFGAGGNAQTTTLQASLVINGAGASQQSAIVVSTGNAVTDANGPALTGNFSGSTMLDPYGQPISTSGTFATVTGGNNTRFYGGNNLAFFALASTGATATSFDPDDATGPGVENGGTTIYNTTLPAVSIQTSQPVLNTSRTTQTLTGYSAGISQGLIEDQYDNEQAIGPIALLGTTTINTNAQNNRVSAQLTFTGNVVGAIGTGNDTLTFSMGSTTGAATGDSSYVNDSIFGATQSASNAATFSAGTNSPPYALVFNGAQSYLVSAGTVTTGSLLPPGVSYCQCQYVQWGFWGTDANGAVTNGSTLNGQVTIPATLTDAVHLGTWVAGPLTSGSDMSTLVTQGATATFNGAAIGTVNNNGAIYEAAGAFNYSYNFGTGAGNATISNFDNQSYGFTTHPLTSVSAPNYTGTLTAGPSGYTGTINGSFYGPSAVETGGNFGISGQSGRYGAVGIFTGRR